MALQHGLHTAWSVPIVSENGTLLGTFGLHHTKAHPVAGDELALLEQAEHIALIAIERDRAQTALTEALAEVRKSEAERGNLANRFDSPFAEITDEDIDSLFSE